MTILDHIEKVQENLNSMVDQMDDDTDYYDATYHLEQIKEKVKQEPCEDAVRREAAREVMQRMWGTSGELLNEELDFVQEHKKIPVNLQITKQEPCEDCISRVAVLERREILKDKQGTGYQAVKTKYIRKLPSVNPQQKTGHWIERQVISNINGEVRNSRECSECHNRFFRYDTSPNTVDFIPNYCPNCGAKMVEPQESEV